MNSDPFNTDAPDAAPAVTPEPAPATNLEPVLAQPDTVVSSEPSASAATPAAAPFAPVVGSAGVGPTVLGAPVVSEAAASAAGSPVPGKKPKKSLVVLVASAAAVLLLGGGSAAAYNLWYQNPQKVLGDIMSSVSTAKSSEFTSKLTVEQADDGVKSLNDLQRMEGTLNGKMNEKGALFDMTANFSYSGSSQSDISLKGSAVTIDKDVYFKVPGLEMTLNDQFGSLGVGAISETPFGPLVKKLDGSWIKLSEGDLDEFSKEASESQKCVTDLSQKLRTDKSYGKELTNVYKKNLFIVVDKKLGAKKVAGVDSLGYQVSVDNEKLAAFVRAAGETKFGKELVDCGDDIDFNKIADDVAKEETSSGKTKSTLEVWASRFGHKLTGVNATIESDGSKSSASMEVFLNKEVTVEAPAKSITVKEIVDDYQKVMADLYGSSYAAPYSNSSSESSYYSTY